MSYIYFQGAILQIFIKKMPSVKIGVENFDCQKVNNIPHKNKLELEKIQQFSTQISLLANIPMLCLFKMIPFGYSMK